jgi:hypothetical protein
MAMLPQLGMREYIRTELPFIPIITSQHGAIDLLHFSLTHLRKRISTSDLYLIFVATISQNA